MCWSPPDPGPASPDLLPLITAVLGHLSPGEPSLTLWEPPSRGGPAWQNGSPQPPRQPPGRLFQAVSLANTGALE